MKKTLTPEEEKQLHELLAEEKERRAKIFKDRYGEWEDDETGEERDERLWETEAAWQRIE